MILHPNISRAELNAYCELCHEYGVKSVSVDKKTADAISRLILHGIPMQFLGVKFKIRNGTT